MFNKSALDILIEDNQWPSIVTLCKLLDKSLGNGVPVGTITEFYGSPGSGKSQICYQLCANVQIPQSLGGLGGKAIFIDTKQGFSPDRMKSIALACQNHCRKVYEINEKHLANDSSLTNFINQDVDEILENILFAFTNNYVELLAAIYSLRDLIETNSNIRLIVIDSFTYPFRSMKNTLERTRIVYETLTDIQKLADQLQCAIVLTNDITTRSFENEILFVPSLGDSYSHKIPQQIALEMDINEKGRFWANIEKCYYMPEVRVPFKITEDGVRGFKN